MTDEHAHEHGGPNISTYLFVFVALCVCTAISFVVNQFLGENEKHTAAAIIMGVAVVKATLVATIFMHLKYDWGRLYCIVVPICILTVMMVIILSIDQTLVWHAYPDRATPQIVAK